MRSDLQHLYAKNPEFKLLVFVERFLKDALREHSKKRMNELAEHLQAEAEREFASESQQLQLELITQLRLALDAFNAAYYAHKKQKRASGEPYLIHPIHTALYEIYHELHEEHEPHVARIIAALLHDTVEDAHISLVEIRQHFGAPVERIVAQLTTNEQWKVWLEQGALSKVEEAALQFTKASQSTDALQVKIHDRLDNLESLDALPAAVATQKVLDTIAVGYVERAIQRSDYRFLEGAKGAVMRYMTDRQLAQISPSEEVLLQVRQLRDMEIEEIDTALAQRA